jgi:hypothetical protein
LDHKYESFDLNIFCRANAWRWRTAGARSHARGQEKNKRTSTPAKALRRVALFGMKKAP